MHAPVIVVVMVMMQRYIKKHLFISVRKHNSVYNFSKEPTSSYQHNECANKNPMLQI